jgi:hypothetical protein
VRSWPGPPGGGGFFIDRCGPETYYLSEPRGGRNLTVRLEAPAAPLVAQVHDAGWRPRLTPAATATDRVLDALILFTSRTEQFRRGSST